MNNRINAVFDSPAQAENALLNLRRRGVRDDQLSVIARSSDDTVVTASQNGKANGDGSDDSADVAKGAGVGVATGAGVGALFGLAAFAIPGIGPFITAGALGATLGSAAAGGAAAGAVVGGTAGAITGALTRVGYDEEDAKFFGEEIERGKVLVAVETGDNVSDDDVREVLRASGGNVR